MSGERLNVFATRMTLTMMKNRSKGAKAGHKLLKRKADALTMKFRSMAKVIKDVRGRPFRASCLVSRWAWVHHFEHAGFSAVGVHRAGLPGAGRALRITHDSAHRRRWIVPRPSVDSELGYAAHRPCSPPLCYARAWIARRTRTRLPEP